MQRRTVAHSGLPGCEACGLCTLSWIESDRWDGRYGIAVATDISEAHQAFMAFVGAVADLESDRKRHQTCEAKAPRHADFAPNCRLHAWGLMWLWR